MQRNNLKSLSNFLVHLDLRNLEKVNQSRRDSVRERGFKAVNDLTDQASLCNNNLSSINTGERIRCDL